MRAAVGVVRAVLPQTEVTCPTLRPIMASTDLGALQPSVVARFSRPLQRFLLGEFPELLQVRKKVF